MGGIETLLRPRYCEAAFAHLRQQTARQLLNRRTKMVYSPSYAESTGKHNLRHLLLR